MTLEPTPGSEPTPDTNVIRDFLLSVAPFPADNEEGFVKIHW